MRIQLTSEIKNKKILEKYSKWHPWFAWRPVKYEKQIVWLERIARQGLPFYEGWGSLRFTWVYKDYPKIQTVLCNKEEYSNFVDYLGND